MAVGNKHLAYKAALNDIEVQSPGAKHDFYFGFLERPPSASGPRSNRIEPPWPRASGAGRPPMPVCAPSAA